MLDPRSEIYPSIEYRPIQPSDLEVLEKIHLALFPIRYEREFFLNVVNGHGIISWGAVDTSRSDEGRDELIGFVTTRMIAAKDSEIEDLFRYNNSHKDLTLLYILTLGVVDSYRNLGIASSLVREVIKHAASVSNCRGVYLHVISYNQPAISFYKKMLFKLARRLPMFYYIRGQHYDSYLFVYYVNGGRTPCSPLPEPVHMGEPVNVVPLPRNYLCEAECIESLMLILPNSHLPCGHLPPYANFGVASRECIIRGFLKMLVAKFWSKEETSMTRWSRCKESTTLLSSQNNNKRVISGEDTRCHV